MDDFDIRMSSTQPVPGGGAAAARTGQHAAALVLKVLRISLKRDLSDEVSRELSGHEASTGNVAQSFETLEERDQQAFMGFLEALRSPKKTDDERDERKRAIRAAAREAIEAPLETLRTTLSLAEVLRRLTELASDGQLRAESDLGAAAELARAVFLTSEWNVRVNLPYLGDDKAASECLEEANALRTRLDASYDSIRTTLLGIVG